MTSLVREKRGLWLDHGLIDQHDGYVVLHRVNAVACAALQAFGTLAVIERLFAGRANKDLEEIFREHEGILRQKKLSPQRTQR
jgi:hypothetical protein